MPVIIGMDPHKRSATIEVIDELGEILTTGKFGTDQVGYAEMLAAGRRFTDRAGCAGETVCAGAGVRHRQRPQD
jgi:transposase